MSNWHIDNCRLLLFNSTFSQFAHSFFVHFSERYISSNPCHWITENSFNGHFYCHWKRTKPFLVVFNFQLFKRLNCKLFYWKRHQIWLNMICVFIAAAINIGRKGSGKLKEIWMRANWMSIRQLGLQIVLRNERKRPNWMRPDNKPSIVQTQTHPSIRYIIRMNICKCKYINFTLYTCLLPRI